MQQKIAQKPECNEATKIAEILLSLWNSKQLKQENE